MELFGNTQMLALGDADEAFDLQVRGAARCECGVRAACGQGLLQEFW